MIVELSLIEDMFANMRRETNWPIDGDMLYGYFFTDPSELKLQAAAEVLAANGYRVVEIRPNEGESYFWLHLERIESHTCKSLYVRCRELNAFAEEHGLESYDGMDVGLAGPS